MQRRITKRLSDALAGEEEDRNRRQVHLNQNPHHTYPSVNPQGPSYPYQDKGYPIQSVSSRGNLSQGNRLAATLNEPSPNYAQQPQYYDRNGGPSDWNPRENINPTPPRQPSPIRVIPDEDVDDVIWNERDEPEPDPEENERVEDDEEDFSPPRVRNDKSREREQRDREDSREAIKPKKTSRTFLLGKKYNRSRSGSTRDSETFESGSSSGRTSGSSSYSGGGSKSNIPARRPSSSSSHSIVASGNDGGRRQGSRTSSTSKFSSSGSRHHVSPSRSGSGRASNSTSREVMALPIEIPESVTDADAFRRYLSRSDSSMESVGMSGSISAFSKTLNQMQSGHSVNRRTMALSQAIMTLALLSASASQLRFVVAYANSQSYPALNYFLISTCIIVEILVGIGYVVLSRFEFTDAFVERVHSYLIFLLFVVAVANVIIASFALDDHVCSDKNKTGVNTNRRLDGYDGIEQEPIPTT